MTTNEQLRSELVAGIDSILGLPWVFKKLVSARNVRLLNALRGFAMDADDATLGKIRARLEREPVSAPAIAPAPADERACILECAVSRLPIGEGGKLAADVLDRFYGMTGGEAAVAGFCSELSEVAAAEVVCGLREQIGGGG